MTGPGLANGILIGFVSSFVGLSVFWYAVEMRAPERIRVDTVLAKWSTDGEGGVEMVLDLQVKNPSRTPAVVEALSYEVSVNGRDVASDEMERALKVPPRASVPLRLRIPWDQDVVAPWWEDYAASGEEAFLRITGHIAVEQQGARHQAAFAHGSSWRGDLVPQLSALSNCKEGGPLCLHKAEFAWDGGDLVARLTLRNQGQEDAELSGLDVHVRLGNGTLSESGWYRYEQIPAGMQQTLELRFPVAGATVADLWHDHVQRCERSDLTLVLEPDADVLRQEEQDEDGYWEVTTPTWELEAKGFQTRFICGRGG